MIIYLETKNPSASSRDAFLAVFIQRCFLYTDLEGNSGQFTNAKRNLRVCASRRNSSPCQIGKNAKMLSAKSKCRIACSIPKSFSCMMRSSTTKWSALSWNCECDEPPSLFIVHPSTFFCRIDGGELFDRVLDDKFILTEKACAIFMRQICEAMDYIHEHNIIHLDLKVSQLRDYR